MQTTKTPLILLALGLLSISLGAPAAHVYRTEGQACRSNPQAAYLIFTST